MNLQLKHQNFIVCGASSGFGLATAKLLVDEQAKVLGIGRTKEKLEQVQKDLGKNFTFLTGDITQSVTIDQIMQHIETKEIAGVVVNAAGPPAKKFEETTITDWDEAYANLVRWKIELTQKLLPKLKAQRYGRMLYIESSAVKQPLENLVLSTAMRLSVIGFVKTLSQELPDQGITFNTLAPGYHYTAAVERLINKKSEIENISFDQAKQAIEQSIPMKKTGDTTNFASLAVWLLSPLSEFVTGQVYAVDGGVVKSTL